MEGKRLYYNTKMCASTACANNHLTAIEEIEDNIVVLFDIQVMNSSIIPKSTTIERATHMQYMDINGFIHILPIGLETIMLTDVVNFRLLTALTPLDFFPSLQTSLEDVVDFYENHLVKPIVKWCS